jgi:hypothetical protein
MISEILANIRTAILTAYPDKFELANPEDIANNPDQFLTDGYSVRADAGSNSGLNSTYMTSIQRNIEVTLSKGFVSSDINPSSRKTTEGLLIDEMIAIIKLLKQDPLVRSKLINIDYNSDDGINLLEKNKLAILITKLSMIVRYNENY